MAKNAATGSGNQVVGKVFIIYGTVKAVAPDGTVRILAPNSPVFANDKIITDSDGSISIMLDGPPPTQLDLGRLTEIVLDEDVYAGATPGAVAEATAEAQQVQEALLQGDQPIELEATAAGGAGDTGGGHPIVMFDLTGSEVTPGSGAETTGITTTSPDTIGGVLGETPPPTGYSGVVTLTATEWISENGGPITYTATVDNAPQGSDLVLTLNNGATITIHVGETAGSVDYTPAPDPDVYKDLGNVPGDIVGYEGGGYTELTLADTVNTEVRDFNDTTTVTITASDVNENADGVTFNIQLSNVPEAGSPATVSVLVGETTHVVPIAADGSGSLFIATADPDVYNDSQTVTATVTAINGGNFEATDVTGASFTADVTDLNAIDTTTVTITASDVNENAAGVTFNIQLSNVPETGSPATVSVLVGTTTHVVPIAADGSGTLFIATSDPDVHNDAQEVTATVTAINGGNFEATDVTGASFTADVTDLNAIDTTTVTLTASSDSVMEGDMITYTAEVDHAPQGDLVITLDDEAGTQITILSGQLLGSSIPVAAPSAPDGGTTLTVGIASTSGGNYEDLNIADTAIVVIGDYTPEGGTVSATVDDEGLSGGIPGGTGDIVVTPDSDFNEATFSGTLAFNFGGDGGGLVTFADMGGEAGTVGTEEVTYTWDSDGNTLTATVSGGARDGMDLFTVEVTDSVSGGYTVTLLNNILHAVGGNENDAVAGLTYTVTDADGSEATGTLNVTFDDDIPRTMAAEPNAIVEDEQIVPGIDEAGDATPDYTATATGNVSNNGPWGADEFAKLTQIQVGEAQAVVVPAGGSVTVYWSQAGVYQGTSATGAAANLVVESDGDYTFTLTDNMLIASGAGELTDTLGTVTFTGADGDGDLATVGLTLQVKDDIPGVFTPETTYIADQLNTAHTVTSSLNFAGHYGADGLGGAVWFTFSEGADALDAGGKQLTLNGADLHLYYGRDGSGNIDQTVLIAKTGSGSEGFRIDIDPAGDSYTMTENGIISSGVIPVNVIDLSSVGGGNDSYKALNIGTSQTPDTNPGNDILVSTTPGETVNTSDWSIGIGDGQSIDTGEIVRLDFVNNLAADVTAPIDPTGFTYTTHNLTSVFRQEVAWVNGNGNAANLKVTAIVADNDSLFVGDVPVEPTIPLNPSHITVFNTTGDVVTSGTNGLLVVDDGNSVNIYGMQAGWDFKILTTTPETQFSAVQVQGLGDYTDTTPNSDVDYDAHNFKLGAFSYETAGTPGPIDLSYGIVGYDGDGDTVNSSIDATLYPSSVSIEGTGGNDAISGTSGNDYIFGYAGNDTLGGGTGHDVLVGGDGTDTLNGGAGNDTLSGGAGDDNLIGGQGTDTLTGGAGADTFIFNESGSSNMDHILDYSASDTIDLSNLLSGVTTENVNLYVKVEQTGSNITVSVDPTGAGSFSSAGVVAVLDGYGTDSQGGDMLDVLIDGTHHQFTV